MSHHSYIRASLMGLLLIGILTGSLASFSQASPGQAHTEAAGPAAEMAEPESRFITPAQTTTPGAVDIYCEAPGHVAEDFPAPATAVLSEGADLEFAIGLECLDENATAVLALPNEQQLTFTTENPVQFSEGLGELDPGSYDYQFSFAGDGPFITPTVTGTLEISGTEGLNVFLPLIAGNSPAANAVINEVLFAPATDDAITDTEWVELYNAGATDINLSSWRMENSTGLLIDFPFLNWPAGTYLLVRFGSGIDDRNFSDGTGVLYTGNSSQVLGDDTDDLVLYNASGTIVDFVNWSTTGTYTGGSTYTAAVNQDQWQEDFTLDGDTFVDLSGETLSAYLRKPMYVAGISLERIDPHTDSDTPQDWLNSGLCDPPESACPAGPTPGGKNQQPAVVDVFEEEPAQRLQQNNKDWTIMWYGSADYLLQNDLFHDLNEMEEVGSDANINIVVMFDASNRLNSICQPGGVNCGSTWRGRLYQQTPQNWNRVSLYVPRGQQAHQGEQNMGAAGTLQGFVSWAQSTYPADRYALILGGHGAGWKGVLPDDGSFDDLRMSELSTALGNISLDLIGFDACLMAGLEVAHQVQPFADVMVASQETEAAAGWPFDDFLDALANNPSMNASTLGTQIVNDFASYYTTVAADPLFTLSAIDLGQVPALAAQVNTLSGKLRSGVEDFQQTRNRNDNVQLKIRDSREGCRLDGRCDEYLDRNYIDLWGIATVIDENANIPDQYKAPEAGQIAAALNASPGIVITTRHGNRHDPNSHGLSIYFPREQECENWHCRGDEPFDDPHQTIYVFDDDRHLYARDVDHEHGFIPNRHPMPEDAGFTFTQQNQWDEFLHRYYKPVADPCIIQDNDCLKAVNVPVGAQVTLTGEGSSDTDGQQDNDSPEYPGRNEYWYWDFAPGVNTDWGDYDKDRRAETDDDNDAQGIVTTFICPEPGVFPIRLMTWDEHYDYQVRPQTFLARHPYGFWYTDDLYGNALDERTFRHWKVDANLVTVTCGEDDVPPPPDLVKRSTATTVVPGGELEYIITVSNNADVPISNVVITDTYDPDTEFVSTDLDPEPQVSPSDIVWRYEQIAANSSETARVRVRVNEEIVPGEIIKNRIEGDSSVGIPQPAEAETTVVEQTAPPALQMSKQATSTVQAGSLLTYTLTISNTGESPAENVEVVDTYPAGTTFVSADPAPDAGTSNVWTIAEIPAGDAVTIVIVLQVDADAAAGTDLQNSATGQLPDGTPVDATTTTTVTEAPPEPLPNLTIGKQAAASVFPGQVLPYTITVDNTGEGAASSLVITDTYDAQTSFVAADPPPDPGTTGNNVWTFENVPSGESVTVLVTVTVSADAANMTLVNTVEASAPGAATVSDTADTVVNEPPVLEVSKTFTPSVVISGEVLTYTITVSNTGAASATGVVVVDELPTGNFDYADGQPVESGFDAAGPFWEPGDLAPNTSLTIEVVGVVFGVTGPDPIDIPNTVRVNSNETGEVSTTIFTPVQP